MEEGTGNTGAGRGGEVLGSEALGEVRAMTEETAQKLLTAIEDSAPVRRLRGSQVATAVAGTVGFALFVVGVERAAEDIPLISNAWGSILVGLILLAVTGALLRKLLGGE
jgi:hypothetical protein